MHEAIVALASLVGFHTSSAFDERLAAEAEVTKRSLEAIHRYTLESGGRLVIVHLGGPNFVDPKAWESYRRRHSHSRYFAKEVFEEWAAERGIVFVEAMDSLLQTTVRGTDVTISYDNHFNERGHEVIADTFWKALRRADEQVRADLAGRPLEQRH